MTSPDARSDISNDASPMSGQVQMKLEVVVIPVSEADRVKSFYQNLGWRLDADFANSDDFRILQFTPTSPASIIFGTGVSRVTPGSAERMVLVVKNIQAARADGNGWLQQEITQRLPGR